MADKVTKEQVYASFGRYLVGELKEYTGHINGGFWPSWCKDENFWVDSRILSALRCCIRWKH